MSDGTINFPERATPPSSPSTGRHRIWVNAADSKPKITDEFGITTGFESTYGSNYQFVQDDFEDTNGSTAFQTYTSIAYPSGLATTGQKYEIEFHALTRYSTGSRNHITRIAIDGVTLEEEIAIEHKDTGADIRFPVGYKYVIDGNQLNNIGGFIDFDFRCQDAADTARVYSCTLTFKRVL